ncbi:hypothetical protein ACIRQP_40475 [Streptomyces sp. NPDC102274]|uniref:hypothetical protein n=1 Tax=Streptomyces sp. NPDC102274 TaxID=3366151 RepID=UPI00382A2E3B
MRLLIAHLADRLDAEGLDGVVWIGPATGQGNAPSAGERHILARRGRGLLRLTMMPARLPDGQERPDPACELTSHQGCALLNPSRYQQADLRTRAACTTTLLSESLCLTNSSRPRFHVVSSPHHLDLPAGTDDADRAIRGWLSTSEFGAELCDEGGWDETVWDHRTSEDTCTLLDAPALTALITALQDDLLRAYLAGSGWPHPDPPADTDTHQLFPWLVRDLCATLADHVVDSPDETPLLAYALGLPLGLSPAHPTDGDDEVGLLLLVGRTRTVALVIDANT